MLTCEAAVGVPLDVDMMRHCGRGPNREHFSLLLLAGEKKVLTFVVLATATTKIKQYQ